MATTLPSSHSAEAPTPVPGPWPYYAEDEIEAVAEVLRSGKVNYWNSTTGRDLEKAFREYFGAKHAIALANGTVAIDLALKALGIGPGDEVIVTPRSFIASVAPVVMLGATPVFADVDRDSGNLSAETIAPKITPRTKAVIPVHLAGWPCDMAPMLDLCRPHGIHVVEDCAQAHGAKYRGVGVGNHGIIGTWSFCTDKIITTGGEGGMVTTADDALWEFMWSYKDHGKSFDAMFHRQHAPGFRWVHESIGTNWRMPSPQAAIGLRQVAKMDDWHATRTRNAKILIEAFEGLDAVRVPTPGPDSVHAYYKFYMYVNREALKPDWSRDRIVAEIEARGVFIQQGSCSEIYLEKAFDGTPFRPEQRLPNARELGETSLLMLVHPTQSEAWMHHAAAVARDVLVEAAR